jgi:uncharacterized lipoprotein YehR (DUF1307 family)
MKKLFYVFALVTVVSLSLTSCTKEEIKPAKQENNGNGVMIKE